MVNNIYKTIISIGRLAVFLVSLSKVQVDNNIISFGRQAVFLYPYPKFRFVVVGGGMSGICSAVSAARLGLSVALLQDRPVLGGNNSSEVRVGLGGTTCEMPYPNVGKLVKEIESGNSDARKLAIVQGESDIALYLNYRANQVEMDSGKITAVIAENIRTGERKRFYGDYFADCTGDGTIGFLAGADFDITSPESGHMGPSNMCSWQNRGYPVPFPSCPWAINLSSGNFPTLGKWYWESGFYLNPFDKIEHIRDWNFMAMYGAWDCLKNIRTNNVNDELTWAAYIAGKRESRRLLGDLILTEEDLVNSIAYPDGCVPTGWSIDVHMPNPAYDPNPSYKGDEFISLVYNSVSYPLPYWVPYRCLYSRNISNLFMAGRDISVTHRALGAVRVQRTTGIMGEIVGMAASLCKKYNTDPRSIYQYHLDDLKQLMLCGVGANPFDLNDFADPCGLIAPETLTASASSNYSSRDAKYAVNRAGMIGQAHTSLTPVGKMWMSEGGSYPQWFKVDLATSCSLVRIKIWNFNWTGYLNRGCKQVDIYWSNSDSNPGNPVDNPDNWTLLGEAGQRILMQALAQMIMAQLIRLNPMKSTFQVLQQDGLHSKLIVVILSPATTAA